MSKKERKMLADALVDAHRARALRWSDYEREPDLRPPTGRGACVDGWSINLHRVLSAYGGFLGDAVYPTWSDTISHGDRPKSGSASQCGIAQFSTRERALCALRRELEDWTAERLVYIDEEIRKEREAPTDGE